MAIADAITDSKGVGCWHRNLRSNYFKIIENPKNIQVSFLIFTELYLHRKREKIKVLNIFIENLSTGELLQQLDERGGIVFTPNIDHLMILQKDREFYNAYKMADYRVCDGQTLMYSLQFLGTPIKEKISGSDFLPIFY